MSETDDQLPPASPTNREASPPEESAESPAVPVAEPPEEQADSEPELEEPKPQEEEPHEEEPHEEEPHEEEAQAPVVIEDTDETAGDPFEGWPAAESAVVIEDSPVDGASVEHVRGEVDVPDGYTVLEGTPLGNRRSVGIVVSRFNGGITNRMLASALEALVTAGVAQDAITVMPVPGAFELPIAAMALAKTRRYACIVALGAIVRGGTPHFDYVASECASGLQLAGIETGVPVAFGVLTVDNVEQAEARIHKAAEAVRSALEMADLFARLRASAR